MKKSLICLILTLILPLNAQPVRELVVTGFGKNTVKATIADVKIAIQMEGKSSSEAQQAVAVRLKPVLEQLKNAQVEKLQTSVVNIYTEYSLPQTSATALSSTTPPPTPTITGYQARIDISFTSPAANAPALIENAFKVGANQLISLSFHPAEDAISLGRIKALQDACQDALLEAKTVMEALGVDSSKILYVNIQPPIPIASFKASQEQANSEIRSTGAEVLQQEQTIKALVDIKLELKETT